MTDTPTPTTATQGGNAARAANSGNGGLDREPALLVLEDGIVFRGRAYAALGQTLGEAVFTTAMTGYQETLTDPSYYRQIVVQTAPHIGNTGVNPQDDESDRVWVAGYVVRDATRVSSNWRATRDLEPWLVEHGVVGITGLDTRALTRHLREAGTMRAGIFSGDALPAGFVDGGDVPESVQVELQERVLAAEPMSGADLARAVSAGERYVVEPDEQWVAANGSEPVAEIVAVDLGIKASSPENLRLRGARVTVVPQHTSLEELLALQPDGVFFSNGPGDPAAATHEVDLVRGVLDAGIPYLGICFGNQLLGRALGFDTYKLRYGHRGINQPVLDRETGRVEITSHNHGFAVDAPTEGQVTAPHDGGRYGRVEVSHLGLNDGVVEGLRALDIPAFSVQYHPEAAAGPHDGTHLFDRFLTSARTYRESRESRASGSGPADTSAHPSSTTSTTDKESR